MVVVPARASRGRRPDRDGQETSEDRLDHRGCRRLGGRLVSPGSGEVTGHRSVRSDAADRRRHGHHVAGGVHRRAGRHQDDTPVGPAPLNGCWPPRWWHPDASSSSPRRSGSCSARHPARAAARRAGESLVAPTVCPADASCSRAPPWGGCSPIADGTRRAVLHIAVRRERRPPRRPPSGWPAAPHDRDRPRTVAAVTEWLAPDVAAAGRPSLRLHREAAPLLGRHVSHRLRELPAMTGEVLHSALTLAVLVLGRLLQHGRAVRPGAARTAHPRRPRAP